MIRRQVVYYSPYRSFAKGTEVYFRYSVHSSFQRIYTLRARATPRLNNTVPSFIEWSNITPQAYPVSQSDLSSNTYTLLPNDIIVNTDTGEEVVNNLKVPKSYAYLKQLKATQESNQLNKVFTSHALIYPKAGDYEVTVNIKSWNTSTNPIPQRLYFQYFGARLGSLNIKVLQPNTQVIIKYVALEDIVDGFGNLAEVNLRVYDDTYNINLINPDTPSLNMYSRFCSSGDYFYAIVRRDRKGGTYMFVTDINAKI